ncbi:unnamed protein product [Lampetra fluviatilis]
MEDVTIVLPIVKNGVSGLGELWNCHSSETTHQNLFKKQLKSEHLIAHPLKKVEYSLKHIKGTEDQVTMVKAQGSMGLELLCGLIKVEGFAEYSNKSVRSVNEEKLICQYNLENFSISLLPIAKTEIDDHVHSQLMKGRIKATHVVYGVILGAEVNAHVLVTRNETKTSDGISGGAVGKLGFGKVTPSLKAQLEWLDTSEANGYRTQIDIHSKPPMKRQPSTVKEMFELVENIDVSVADEQHYKFSDANITGVPIRWVLVPIAQFLDVDVEKLYVQINDTLLCDFRAMLISLQDSRHPDCIKRRVLEKDHRLQRILSDSSSPLSQDISQYEKELNKNVESFFICAYFHWCLDMETAAKQTDGQPSQESGNNVNKDDVYMEDITIVLPIVKNGVSGLGELWNCHSSETTHQNLFKKQLTSEHLIAHPLKKLEYSLKHIKGTEDQITMFKAQGSMGLELLCGLIKVEGFAEYSNKSVRSMNEEKLICQYNLENFSISLLPIAKTEIDDHVHRQLMNGRIKATHVAYGVILGAEVNAHVLVTRNETKTRDGISGGALGKLGFGKVTASLKAQLEWLDTSEANDYSTQIDIHSKPPMKRQPSTVKEMFELVENIDVSVANEQHYKFSDANITGVPIRWVLVPIAHFLDVAVEKLYLQISETLLCDFRAMLISLQDSRQPDCIKRRVLEKEHRLQHILSDSSSPLSQDISQYEKILNKNVESFFMYACKALIDYKQAVITSSELHKIIEEYEMSQFSAVDISAKVDEFVMDGKHELDGIHEKDATQMEAKICTFTNRALLNEWMNTESNIKILLQTKGDPSSGVFHRLFKISHALKEHNIDVGIALPSISNNVSLTIKAREHQKCYQAADIAPILGIVSAAVNMGSSAENQLYTIMASRFNITLPLQPNELNDLHRLVELLKIGDVHIASSYMESLECLWSDNSYWMFFVPIDALDTAYESIVGLRDNLKRFACANGKWVVGRLEIANQHEAPLLFVLRDKEVKAICLDHLDIIILVDLFNKAATSENNDPDLSDLSPESLKCSIYHNRAIYAVKTMELMGQANHSEDNYNHLRMQSFEDNIDEKLTDALHIVRSCLSRVDADVIAMVTRFAIRDNQQICRILEKYGWRNVDCSFGKDRLELKDCELISTGLQEWLSSHDYVVSSENQDVMTHQTQEQNKASLSRLDCIVAVLSSADCTVVQEMLQIMTKFQMALPLVMPDLELAGKLKVMLPLLAGNTIKWEAQSGVIIENHLFLSPFRLILAVRLGSGPCGKSTILNQLMAVENMFSSCGEPGAQGGPPLTLAGTVEFTWLTQETCSASLWESVMQQFYSQGQQEIVLLANLHGDALEHPTTLEFLKKFTSAYLIFMMPGTKNVLEEGYAEFGKHARSEDESFFLLVDPSADCEEADENIIQTSTLTKDATLEKSSGKSTLLNALFACKFAVSVGRCTRGLFMRLLFLEEKLVTKLKCDAIVLIDTEGLGAPEKMNDDNAEQKDRILATFVMSVSNLTLINVLGEYMRDLTEILQIAIVAMARLGKVKMAPDILMVQHLTERNSAMMSSAENQFCQAIEMALELTEKKDFDMGIADVSCLKNLTDRIQNGMLLKQFRQFKNGARAGSPPSEQYHKDVLDLYETILDTCAKSGGSVLFSEWQSRLQSFWSCVFKDNFAVRFKNLKEIYEFIDRGHRIAAVKEAADAAFFSHGEKLKKQMRTEVQDWNANTQRLAYQNVLRIFEEELNTVPYGDIDVGQFVQTLNWETDISTPQKKYHILPKSGEESVEKLTVEMKDVIWLWEYFDVPYWNYDYKPQHFDKSKLGSEFAQGHTISWHETGEKTKRL